MAIEDIPTVPPYGGEFPDRQTQDRNTFAENIFSYISWAGNAFLTNFNLSIGKINAMFAGLNQVKTDVEEIKEDVEEIETHVVSVQSAIDATVGNIYKGDWSQNDNFASSIVNHNSLVWSALIKEPQVLEGSEPTLTNSDWICLTRLLEMESTPKLSASLDCQGNPFLNSCYVQQPDIDSTATTVLDFSLGGMVKVTIVGDTDFTFANFPSGQVCTMYLDIIGGEDWTITFPSGTLTSKGKPLKFTGGVDALWIVKDGSDKYSVSVAMNDKKGIN